MRLTKKITEKFPIPNDPDHGWIEIAHLKGNKIDEALKGVENVTQHVGSMPVITYDPYGKVKALAVACIIGWGNIFDELGRPLDFDKESFDRAAEFEISVTIPAIAEDQEPVVKKMGLYTWIDRCRVELAAKVLKEEEAAKGN